MNEELLKSYEELKRNRNIINTIEPDFFFKIVDCLLKENEELNNRCRNLDKEAQAYLEELAGDNTLTRRTIKQLQEENEELKNDYENLSNSVVVKNYYIENSIPVQKVKDKIEHYQKLQHNYIEKYDEINEGLQAMISALQELLGKE